MSYSVIGFRGFFYIKGEKSDPVLTTGVGPYRFQLDAQRVADELNKNAPTQKPTS